MPTLDLHGGINKYAIYNGASDAPLIDPFNNLSSVIWHSDFVYIGAQQTVTGTVNLDPLTSGWVGTEVIGSSSGGPVTIITYPYTIRLATHGLSYSPFFQGYIQVGSERLSINGSFLYGYHSYNVYSDATGIYLTCDRLVPIAFSYGLVCNFSLRILNAGTDAGGTTVLPNYYVGFEATASRMQCGYWDTNNRYFIQDAGGELRFHTGATIDVQLFQPKYRSATCRAACIVFKSGSYIHTDLASNAQSTAFDAPYYQIAVK